MLTQPFINGYRHDYSCIEQLIDGAAVTGRAISSISYDDGVNRGDVRGGARVSLGSTPGDYKATAEFELPKLELAKFLRVVTRNGSRGIYDVTFELTVSYAALGSPLQVDQIIGCRIDKVSENHAKGADGLVAKVTLNPHVIIRDGINPLDPDSMLL
jgi:hypothetical protein